MLLKQEYVQIGGDLAVGSLLAQVHYWSLPSANGKSKLRVKRDGHLWVAKTREEWCRETGLTLKQYKRAIAILKAKGLVESRVMKFGPNTVTHLRLRAEAFDASLAFVRGIDVEAPNGPTGWSQTAQLDGPFGTTPYTVTTTGTTTESTCEKPGAVSDHAETGPQPPGKGNQGEMNLTEVLKKAEEKKYGDSSKVSLASLWQRRISALHGSFQPPLTGKTLGQLKQLRVKIGDAAEATKVLDWAFDNWWQFTKKAEAMYNLTGVPTTPVIGFMLQNVQLLVNMFLQSVATPPVSAPKAVKAIKAVPVAAKPPEADAEPYKPSWQEIQATIEQIQSGAIQ